MWSDQKVVSLLCYAELAWLVLIFSVGSRCFAWATHNDAVQERMEVPLAYYKRWRGPKGGLHCILSSHRGNHLSFAMSPRYSTSQLPSPFTPQLFVPPCHAQRSRLELSELRLVPAQMMRVPPPLHRPSLGVCRLVIFQGVRAALPQHALV